MERVAAAGNASTEVGNSERGVSLAQFRDAIQERINSDEMARMAVENPSKARSEIRSICEKAFEEAPWSSIPSDHQGEYVEQTINAMLGFGPIEEYLSDEEITEIMVNGSQSLFIEKRGKLIKKENTFSSDEDIRMLIDRIISPLGRRVDELSPMVNARLPQGYRVNAVIPPLSLDGPIITIRKFGKCTLQLRHYVESGAVDDLLRQFFMWAIAARRNIAVSGGTGSGKTTLLNALSCEISHSERIITIEDSAELSFKEHPHVLRLEARVRNAEGTGEVTIRDLVTNALRMRPDRIIVGECRNGEALDMLQAMNTGHDGSLTTLHANSPLEAVMRLATMVRYAVELPIDVIERQIAHAIHLVIQTVRDISGARFVSEVVSYRFEESSRSILVETIYQRKLFSDKGVWGSVPFWVEDLVAQDIAGAGEVDAWKRAVCSR